jgi:nickel-type superoxide dismutase maturation protease
MSWVGSSATLLAVTGTDRAGDPGAHEVPPLVSAWIKVRVIGPSMSPTVKSGDRLLVRRVGRADRIRPGDVVLARFPARPDLLVVKRVARPVPGGAWVVGDNPLVTDDSRAYGTAVVVGRVLARLWPRPGRLPAAPHGDDATRRSA